MANTPVSPAKIAAATAAYQQALAEGCTPIGQHICTGKTSAITRAAAILKQPPCTIRRHLGYARIQGLFDQPAAEKPRVRVAAGSAPLVVPPSLDERVEIATLRRHRQGLQAQLDEAHREIADWRATRRVAVGLRDCPPEPLVWPAADVTAKAAGVPCMLWSDWHVGETVFADQVHGVNRYDRQTTEARIERLVERSIYMATRHVANPQTDHAVLFLNGDFVSGWQHDEHVATDWCTPLEAVRHAIGYLRGAIRRLLQVFGRLVVIGCVGNHGRLFHKKPPAKIQVHQSFDWLVYGALEEAFADEVRVTFATPSTGDYIIKVANTRYLVMHGHNLGVKGGDALIGLVGPMVRGRLKTGRSSASYGRDFDVLVLGHFHDPVWLPANGVIVNNSLVGFNEYALILRYVATTPSQWMWWTDPKWGPSCPVQVYVEDPIKETQPAQGLVL